MAEPMGVSDGFQASETQKAPEYGAFCLDMAEEVSAKLTSIEV
jgi:hypothetical protein